MAKKHYSPVGAQGFIVCLWVIFVGIPLLVLAITGVWAMTDWINSLH